MNAKNLVVTAALIAAGFSFAGSANADATPGKTRAEVRAELIQANKDGNTFPNDDAFPTQQPFVSTRTRAEVKAELLQARADGTLFPNDEAFPTDQKFVSTKTRAQVKAELLQARADGVLPNDENYPVTQPFHSTTTRAAVKAELVRPAMIIAVINGPNSRKMAIPDK